MFEEDEDSVEQSFQWLTDLYPKAEFSTFFNEDYNTTRNIIATNLMAAPPEFQALIKSGIATSIMNSDISYRIRRTSAPAVPLRSDSYLRSDAQIYLEAVGRDLKVKF